MAKRWKSVKTNILLGYFTLIVIASVTIWVIFNETLAISESQVDMNPVNDKILITNSILTDLYEAEGLERSYLQTENTEHFLEYKQLMDSISYQVDSLGKIANNPAQKMHTDSIQELLLQKRKNLNELVAIKNAGSSEKLYDRAMLRLTANKDSINQLLSIYKTVTTSKDSIFVKQKKDRLVDRLIHVFSPQNEPDSTLQVVVNQSVQVDSILNTFNPSDSVARFLSSIIEDIQEESVVYEKQLINKEQEILANDQTITLQIRQMLSKLENEDLVNSLLEVESQQGRINNMTNIVITLGIVALAIILGFLVLILKDISKSQHYRQHLEKEKAYSESLLKSKEQFMLSITHDLKSPLGSIIGFSQLAEKENATERQKYYLKNIGKSASYILKLTNDLLDFARLETGNLKTENIRFNLKALMDEIVEGFYPMASSKNLRLELHTADLPDHNYSGDPVRIKQVLGNLISNAIKFTHKGRVIVSVSVSETKGQTDRVQFDVIDTGIGISKENSQLIFEEFSRVYSEGSSQYEGAGLGLTITKRIVELLDGTISHNSQYTKGSHFTVFLPLVRLNTRLPDEHLQKTATTPVDTTQFTFNNERVLLVDDDPFLLEMAANVLQSANLQVTPFTESEKAVKAISKQPFDLLITDIQMPGKDGFELLSAFRKNTPKLTRAIAMSGEAAGQHKFKSAGFSDFIQKPFQPEELLAKVAFVIDGKKVASTQTNSLPDNGETNNYSTKGIEAFASGDPETTRKILISFIESTAENTRLFRQYLQKGDVELLSKLAHKMLPMFRQLEAKAVVAPLAKLEQNNFNKQEKDEWEKTARSALLEIEKLMEKIGEEYQIPLSDELIL